MIEVAVEVLDVVEVVVEVAVAVAVASFYNSDGVIQARIAQWQSKRLQLARSLVQSRFHAVHSFFSHPGH